jgi:hypothetical protein
MSDIADPSSMTRLVPLPESASRSTLLDRVRHAIRMRHYSRRTESTYGHWIRRFILFHKKRHPGTMGAPEITAFLSWLATSKRVSASTQNQALSALLFLYRHVLRIEIGALEPVTRAKMPNRVPVVLTEEEVVRSTRTPRMPGPGNSYFRPHEAVGIRDGVHPVATICTNRPCSAPSPPPPGRPGL